MSGPPGAAAPSPIPLAGPLYRARCVEVGWPEPDEFDRITELRNREAVRSRFLDPRPLDLVANRAWLAHGMKRPREAVLSIRLLANGAFVGTVGWSGFDAEAGTFELGRTMVDARALLPCRDLLPDDYLGVGADATLALRDFGFERLSLRRMSCVAIGDNALSRRMLALAGAREVDTVTATRADGTEVALVRYEMTRDEWRAIVAADTGGTRSR